MKYIYLSDNIVSEIIPEENPIFPGVPVEQRYAPDFVSKLKQVPDETPVEQNWVYDPDSDTFSAPPKPVEPEPEPEPEPEGYTITEEEVSAAYKEGVNNVE